jgi:hypothetical protein
MKLHPLRRTAAAAVVGSVALTGLMAAAPSPATAATTYGSVSLDVDAHDDEDCDATSVPSGPASAALTDNGVPVTQSFAVTGTVTDPDNPADVTTLAGNASIRTTVTPIAGGPATVTVTGSAAASANARLGSASVCDGHAYGNGYSEFGFKLAAPMWVTITGTGAGTGAGSASLSVGSDAISVGVDVAPRTTSTSTALLPAGDYWFGANVSANARGASTGTPRSSSITASLGLRLDPVGAASALAGPGAKFVSLGGRNCATNSVTATFAKSVKKKATQVQLNVNDKKRLKIAKPKKLRKTRSVVLGGLTPSAATTVSAVIKLKNGKKVTVSRSYLACS